MRPRRSRKAKKSALRRTIAAVAVVGSLAAGASLGAMVYYLRSLPPLRLSDFTDLPAASVVYARDGGFLGRYATEGDRRPLRSMDDAGPYLPMAFIAAEDKDFYRHNGVDILAMARSAWYDLTRGKIVSGASTITQQTVKLALFPHQERTMRRKLQEIALAIELERQQTKSQILLEYLNQIYFGVFGGVPVYGAESAALHVFGKHARALTPAEAALLAAVPNNPTYFSLTRHPNRALHRHEFILQRMMRLSAITPPQYLQARRERVLDAMVKDATAERPYESKEPYIMTEVRRQAVEILCRELEITELEAADQLAKGGLSIYTSVDPNLQTRMDRAASAPDSFPPPISYSYSDGHRRQTVTQAQEQVGSVVLENATGRVLALAGGRDFSSNQVNHANAQRQPGSAIKPLVVYGPALELGYVTPGTIVDDTPKRYPDPHSQTGEWFPQNWDHQFHGLMTVRDALMQSYNAPAIDLLNRVGTETGASYARRLGLRGLKPEDAESLGLAIGGTNGGVSPMQLAAAYAALPRGGLYNSPSLIDRIEDQAGREVYRRAPGAVRVFNPQTAYLLTHMLQSVITSPYGTAHLLAPLAKRGNLAGKTGTTDDNKDAWFVGITPRYTMSAWVGYDIPFPLLSVGRYREGARPQRLFAAVMGPSVLASKARFTIPPDIVFSRVCTKSGALPSPLCKAARSTERAAFVRGTEPTSICQIHQRVLTAIVDGRKVLATEFTPPDQIRSEILIVRPWIPLSPGDRKFEPIDAKEALPAEIDPRGGVPLCSLPVAGSSSTPR